MCTIVSVVGGGRQRAVVSTNLWRQPKDAHLVGLDLGTVTVHGPVQGCMTGFVRKRRVCLAAVVPPARWPMSVIINGAARKFEGVN